MVFHDERRGRPSCDIREWSSWHAGTPIFGLNLEHLQRLYYHPNHTGAVFKVFKRLQEAKITTLRVVVNSEQFNRPHNLQLSTPTKSPRRLYRESAACQSVVDASWERFSTVLTRNFESLRKFFVAWKHEATMGKFCVHSKSAGHHWKGSGDMTDQDLSNSDDVYHQAAAYCEGWKAPHFEFVQAREA